MNTLLLSVLLAPTPAEACGGFFCNRDQPVDQSGETIVFEVDETEDKVTMHVQVDYEGPAESFAWVVPVKGVPDLFRSHDALFTGLLNLTGRSFGVRTDNSDCENGTYLYDYDAGYPSASSSFSDSGAPPSGGGGVTVLDAGTVASYETVTLSAEDSTVLVEWLQDNDFDVPDTMADALAPYVAGGMNFVALKLQKDADTGNLAPLAMRYDGTVPAVPLTLTAVAATDDMPMTIYLLGEARGVPLNYLHVGLNPLAIDYWSSGNNLDDVISRAADEAGGQAFATESATELSSVRSLLYTEGQYDTTVLEGLGPADFVAALPNAGFFGSQEVLDVLREHIPVPASFPYDENDFYNNPSYYADYYDLITDFDVDAAIADLVDAEVEPRQAAQEMLERASWLTRLRSSVSPAEMTLDPHFGFNPDLPPAESIAWLDVKRLCDTVVRDYRDAPQLLTYPYGQSLVIPSEASLADRGVSAFEYVSDQSAFAALWIEQMSTSGAPDVLVDQSGNGTTSNPTMPGTNMPGTYTNDPSLAGNGGGSEEKAGCGCSATGSAVGWLPLLGLLALGRRR